jgi:hypothetical protein
MIKRSDSTLLNYTKCFIIARKSYQKSSEKKVVLNFIKFLKRLFSYELSKISKKLTKKFIFFVFRDSGVFSRISRENIIKFLYYGVKYV